MRLLAARIGLEHHLEHIKDVTTAAVRDLPHLSMARLQEKTSEIRNKIEKKFMERDIGKIARQEEDSGGDAAEREAEDAMSRLEMEVRKKITQRESEWQGANDFVQRRGAAEREIRDAIIIRETIDVIMKDINEQQEAFKKRENEIQDAINQELESVMDKEFYRYEEWWNKHWPSLERASKNMNNALAKVIFEIGFNERPD